MHIHCQGNDELGQEITHKKILISIMMREEKVFETLQKLFHLNKFLFNEMNYSPCQSVFLTLFYLFNKNSPGPISG